MALVVLSPDAAEQLGGLPRPIQARMATIFERLEDWPEMSGAKRLTGDLAGKYRIRTGDCRIQFGVEGETVRVEKIGHRDGFYED